MSTGPAQERRLPGPTSATPRPRTPIVAKPIKYPVLSEVSVVIPAQFARSAAWSHAGFDQAGATMATNIPRATQTKPARRAAPASGLLHQGIS